MHVVIGGAGEVGRSIADALRTQDRDEVVLIDVDREACEEASYLDCKILNGHAASEATLQKAGIEDTDVFYAVTSEDEVNLAASAVAKSYGAERVYARVNSLDLVSEAEDDAFTSIGIDVAVAPDLVAAKKLVRLIDLPGILEIDAFDMAQLRIVETRVAPDSPAAGQRLRDLDLPSGINVVALFRGAEAIIPSGQDSLHRGDHAVVVVESEDRIPDVVARFGDRSLATGGHQAADHVVVAGATGVARRLAETLDDAGHRVTMIAQSDERQEIETLAADMEDILVLEGSSRDVRVFREESLDEADVVVAASPHEEFNLMTALLAKALGVPRTMAIVDQPEIEELAERIGVDVAVSPRMSAVGSLLKFASDLAPEEMTLLHHGDAQAVLLEVDADHPLAGKRLKDAGLPRGAAVGALIRGGQTIVPRGKERIRPGDGVILFATDSAAQELSDGM